MCYDLRTIFDNFHTPYDVDDRQTWLRRERLWCAPTATSVGSSYITTRCAKPRGEFCAPRQFLDDSAPPEEGCRLVPLGRITTESCSPARCRVSARLESAAGAAAVGERLAAALPPACLARKPPWHHTTPESTDARTAPDSCRRWDQSSCHTRRTGRSTAADRCATRSNTLRCRSRSRCCSSHTMC
jgi:hypothetical protein